MSEPGGALMRCSSAGGVQLADFDTSGIDGVPDEAAWASRRAERLRAAAVPR